jgi:hypothetical protein
MVPGITPDVFAREMIRAYIKVECKGKPKRIEQSYVEREIARRQQSAFQRRELLVCESISSLLNRRFINHIKRLADWAYFAFMRFWAREAE